MPPIQRILTIQPAFLPPSGRISYFSALPIRPRDKENILIITLNPNKITPTQQLHLKFKTRLELELNHISSLLDTKDGIDLVAIDLNNIAFISSETLGMFIAFKQKVSDKLNKNLIFYGTNDLAYGVFERSRLADNGYNVYKSKTLEEALGTSIPLTPESD